MNILFFGRGVIATQYAWAFEKAGHTVSFYVRPGRKEQYGKTVHLHLLDGRQNPKGTPVTETWPLTLHETLTDSYDLVILSVNHDQLPTALQTLRTTIKKATFLLFNNIWTELGPIESLLPAGQVLWGFPGAGGGFSDPHTLEGGFMKTIFLQSQASASSLTRHQEVVTLFEKAGFKVSQPRNIQNWLWSHFLLNVAMSTEALQWGSHEKVMQTPAALKEMRLLLREFLPLLKAKGGKPDATLSIFVHLPAALSVSLFQKFSASDTLAGKIMHAADKSGHITREMNLAFLHDVLLDQQKYNLPLPLMQSMRTRSAF